MNMPATPAPLPLVTARGLGHGWPGRAVLNDLSFNIAPGLTLVQGGDGRGKTTLLRLLAGELVPGAGSLRHEAATLWFEHPTDAAHDPVVAQAWLDERRARQPAWRAEVASALADALGLAEHLAKPLYMLSAGSRRKVGLLGAAASGAALTLLDGPFAALDARSCRVVEQLLAEAADDSVRAWVLADYALPPALAGVPLAGFIDLGD